MIKLTLLGKPISLNHYKNPVCNGKFPRMYVKPEVKEQVADWQRQAQLQYKDNPITASLSLTMRYYHKDKRKHDIDNYSKVILDLLSGILYDDDSQIDELIQQKFLDRDNPRIEIIVN